MKQQIEELNSLLERVLKMKIELEECENYAGKIANIIKDTIVTKELKDLPIAPITMKSMAGAPVLMTAVFDIQKDMTLRKGDSLTLNFNFNIGDSGKSVCYEERK